MIPQRQQPLALIRANLKLVDEGDTHILRFLRNELQTEQAVFVVLNFSESARTAALSYNFTLVKVIFSSRGDVDIWDCAVNLPPFRILVLEG